MKCYFFIIRTLSGFTFVRAIPIRFKTYLRTEERLSAFPKILFNNHRVIAGYYFGTITGKVTKIPTLNQLRLLRSTVKIPLTKCGVDDGIDRIKGVIEEFYGEIVDVIEYDYPKFDDQIKTIYGQLPEKFTMDLEETIKNCEKFSSNIFVG